MIIYDTLVPGIKKNKKTKNKKVDIQSLLSYMEYSYNTPNIHYDVKFTNRITDSVLLVYDFTRDSGGLPSTNGNWIKILDYQRR